MLDKPPRLKVIGQKGCTKSPSLFLLLAVAIFFLCILATTVVAQASDSSGRRRTGASQDTRTSKNTDPSTRDFGSVVMRTARLWNSTEGMKDSEAILEVDGHVVQRWHAKTPTSEEGYTQLYKTLTRARNSLRPLRVVAIGDSITDSLYRWPRAFEEIARSSVGDAGPGLMYAMNVSSPYKLHVKVYSTMWQSVTKAEWYIYKRYGKHSPMGYETRFMWKLMTPLQLSTDVHDDANDITIHSMRPMNLAKIFYLKMVGGHDMYVLDHSYRQLARIHTAVKEESQEGIASVTLPLEDCVPTCVLRIRPVLNASHPVSTKLALFGVYGEHTQQQGIVMSAVGASRSKLEDFYNRWDARSRTAILTALQPDLIVFAMGTNNRGESRLIMDLGLKSLAHLRKILPDVSVLVVSHFHPVLKNSSEHWMDREISLALERATRIANEQNDQSSEYAMFLDMGKYFHGREALTHRIVCKEGNPHPCEYGDRWIAQKILEALWTPLNSAYMSHERGFITRGVTNEIREERMVPASPLGSGIVSGASDGSLGTTWSFSEDTISLPSFRMAGTHPLERAKSILEEGTTSGTASLRFFIPEVMSESKVHLVMDVQATSTDANDHAVPLASSIHGSDSLQSWAEGKAHPGRDSVVMSHHVGVVGKRTGTFGKSTVSIYTGSAASGEETEVELQGAWVLREDGSMQYSQGNPNELGIRAMRPFVQCYDLESQHLFVAVSPTKWRRMTLDD